MGLGLGLGLGLGVVRLDACEAVCLAGLRARLGPAEAGVVVTRPGGALEGVVLHLVRVGVMVGVGAGVEVRVGVRVGVRVRVSITVKSKAHRQRLTDDGALALDEVEGAGREAGLVRGRGRG